MTAILGLSGQYHDAAAALIVDGHVVAAVTEERLSRVKHDASLPQWAAQACLSMAGLTAADLDHLVWYERPVRKYARVLITQLQTFPYSLRAFQRAQRSWLTDKLWIRSKLVDTFGVPQDKVLFCEHHRAHAASAFYSSPCEHAAVLVADGVGEWASTTLYNAGPDGLKARSEIHFPHSLGLFYSAITAYLGFRVNNGEYKVMGLAAFGSPRFEDALRKVLRLHDDGSFEVDTSLRVVPPQRRPLLQ